MILPAADTILAGFGVFCRVGGCLMIAPGFSASQIPVRVRLYVALAASLSLTPLLLGVESTGIGDGSGLRLLALFFTETVTGLLIGFLARLFFFALEFITVAITQAIGLGGIPGTTIADDEQLPALATLYTLAATTLMFVAGLHGELLRGLVDSYSTIPPGGGLAARVSLVDVTDQLSATFLVALRIGSPFIIYSIVVNFAVGITNKLTPQIPVFFIATPFIMIGGLFLLFFTVQELFQYFQAAFAAWLTRG